MHALRHDPDVEIAGLLTALTRGYDRVSVHGVPRALLHEQARSIGLPLFETWIDPDSTNEAYETAFLGTLSEIRGRAPSVTRVAFGDLFLQSVRDYREKILAGSSFDPLFPIWGLDTTTLSRRFISDGFVARIVCVDTAQLDPSFAGRAYDAALLAELPPEVDPCGERGEFHTFVSDGPLFRAPVAYRVGGTVLRDERFMFCSLEEQ